MSSFSEQSFGTDVRALVGNARWALRLTWSTNAPLTVAVVVVALGRGIIPAGLALTVRGLINAAVSALDSVRSVSFTYLILDEPTSNLDARAEHELFCRFRDLAKGRTTILISRRFSTVSMADRILVMARGRVIESGTYHELLAKAGTYASLYDLHQHQRASSIRQ